MLSAPHIVILAAGRGTRMRSSKPKVLQPLLFRPMLHHVLDVAQALPHRSVSVVVGHGAEDVRESCRGYSVQFFTQERQLGTAHALRCAEPFLARQEGEVLVLSGDTTLLAESTLSGLLRAHAESGARATVATARVAEPAGYGRVIRRDGAVVDIREHADCSAQERLIDEINGGVYCFAIRPLLEALALIGNANRQGEYYLPDALRLIAAGGGTLASFQAADHSEFWGVNDFAALAEAEARLSRRVNKAFMLQGLRLEDPATTRIDPRCRFGRDVTIEAGCVLVASELEDGATVERLSRVVGSSVGPGARIRQGSCVEESSVGAGSWVGPYAHLRPGSVLGREVRVGNFVETKSASLGDGTKAAHLSYIGDAEIGRGVNVGCGFITCNYDGVAKRRTVIEDDVFIGSDSQTVAPVRVAAGSYIASGSTVTEDVPAQSLVISRGRQVTKPGYAKKYGERRGSPSRP